MPRPDLTREQIAKLQTVVGQQMNYLLRLRTRMEQRGFTATYPKLHRLVCEAFDKAHALSVELHYMGCDQGTVGRE